MWWSDRRHFAGALVALTCLGACGFTPVYAPGGSGSVLNRSVTLDTPQTNNGFALRQQLQERLGPAETPRFQMVVTLNSSQERVAISTTQDTRRYTILGEAKYTLRSLDGDVIVRGDVDSFTSYSATGTTVATLAAERDAYRRLMIILADAIVDRLLTTVPAEALQ